MNARNLQSDRFRSQIDAKQDQIHFTETNILCHLHTHTHTIRMEEGGDENLPHNSFVGRTMEFFYEKRNEIICYFINPLSLAERSFVSLLHFMGEILFNATCLKFPSI
jgi:hypothetical protein